MSELVVRGLSKSFGGASVLHDVDLRVPTGSLAAVLGPSGGGKTTLLRLVAGFDAPDAGTVTLDGRIVARGRHVLVPPEGRRIGVVPQEGALFPHLSVAGNVAFGLGSTRRRGARAGAERRARVAEMLELVGLADHGSRMPGELSGGQQQRVAVARALAPDPALVLLDEPFSALDTALRASVREDVRMALRATGATAVLVTHDQQEALSVADLVAVLRAGTVVQAAAPDQLYTSPGDVGVATFVGEAVVLPATLRGRCAETALGMLPVRPPGSLGAAAVGQVVIRPEQVVLGAPEAGVRARVEATTYFGHDALVQLELLSAGPVRPPLRVSARAHGHEVVPDRTVVGLRVAGEVVFFPAVSPEAMSLEAVPAEG